jgi:uncharacterized surface protein with fasciclin (FAS1) repeats
MPTLRLQALVVLPLALSLACKSKEASPSAAAPSSPSASLATVADASSPKTIAAIAAGSQDHTTLVAALKAADLVGSLATPGPLTVFAPVNSAFDKLPAGTVETLLKPENVAQLRTVLRHHVAVSTYKLSELTDGMQLSMLDGGPVTVKRQGDEVTLDGAKIIGTVPAANGVVFVVDGVMVPKQQ